MTTKPQNICSDIKASLVQAGIFPETEDETGKTWRISPEPYYLSSEEVEFFSQLGDHLLKFYSTLNLLYLDSAKGKLPGWIAEYLDQGKPAELLAFSRMKRFKRDLPGIIRPDVMVTEDGFAVTELDSVPGGFGVTAQMMALYQEMGHDVVGKDEGGIPDLFYKMVESLAGSARCALAIVVSDEASDYRAEMDVLSKMLRDKGLPVYAVHPSEVRFREEGLFVEAEGRQVRIDVLYRFFELFDLKNIPKSELMMYSHKKGQVKTTPPYKPHLEEKLSFALFHHPALRSIWEKSLGSETFTLLSHLIPKTWILDNRELPPHGVIPGLQVAGHSISRWDELNSLTQKERELVVKTSGFSPNAWGSRGVVVGHDVSSEDWQQALAEGVANFPEEPSILQVFHKGKRRKISYFDFASQELVSMESRVRLTPYYFVVEGKARLAGVLATLCPQNKKKIHGMKDAVMVPCARRDS